MKLCDEMPVGQFGTHTIAFSKDGAKQYLLTRSDSGEFKWKEIKKAK